MAVVIGASLGTLVSWWPFVWLGTIPGTGQDLCRYGWLMANKVAAEYNDAVEEIYMLQPRARGFAMTERTDGGCWFCGKVDKFLIYEEEFDCYVHADCIRKALEDGDKTGKTLTEAKRMSYLLGDGI